MSEQPALKDLPDEPGVWSRHDEVWSFRSFEGRLYGRRLFFHNVPSTHDVGQTIYWRDLPRGNWSKAVPASESAAAREEIARLQQEAKGLRKIIVGMDIIESCSKHDESGNEFVRDNLRQSLGELDWLTEAKERQIRQDQTALEDFVRLEQLEAENAKLREELKQYMDWLDKITSQAVRASISSFPCGGCGKFGDVFLLGVGGVSEPWHADCAAKALAEYAKIRSDYDGISGALVDAGDVTLYAGDLARSVRELVGQRDKLRDLLQG